MFNFAFFLVGTQDTLRYDKGPLACVSWGPLYPKYPSRFSLIFHNSFFSTSSPFWRRPTQRVGRQAQEEYGGSEFQL